MSIVWLILAALAGVAAIVVIVDMIRFGRGDRLMFHSPDGAETWFTKELLGQAIVLLNKTEEA